jgi:hypothetical protein
MIEYLYLLATLPFIATSVIFFLKYKKSITEINSYLDDLNKPFREGYYDGNMPIVTKDDDGKILTSDCYEYVVYVEELDKYTNGESKIKLIRSEIISGISQNQYNYIERVVSSRFCSVRASSDITWLESEKSLKKQRKEKLLVILEKI